METPSNLEQEIADIEQRLAEKKAALQEAQGAVAPEAVSDKNVLHEVVGEKIQEMLPSAPSINSGQASTGQTLPVTPVPPALPSAHAPSYLSSDLKDAVQQLVNIAFTDGLTSAIKAVHKLNNPALLDAFHDVLVDQLYDTLIERGKLEKI